MIKVIIFDMWWTLIYRETGFRISEEIKRIFRIRLSRRQITKIFEHTTQRKVWDSEDKMFASLCKALKIPPTKEAVMLLRGIRDYSLTQTKLYKHTLPMIRQLKKQGYKVAIMSNSTCFDARYMEQRTHLTRHVDYKFFSFDHGMIKPNPAFYRKVLKATGYRPEEALMIGDNRTDDFSAPKKTGMNAILYKNYTQLKKDLKRYSIRI